MYEKLKDAGSMLWLNLDQQERQMLVYALVWLLTQLVLLVSQARKAQALQRENAKLALERTSHQFEERQAEHELRFARTIAAEIRKELAGGG